MPQLLIQKLGLFFFPHGGNETPPFSSSQNKTPEYALLAALTLAFSMIINLAMYRGLQRIDMIESLKSIE